MLTGSIMPRNAYGRRDAGPRARRSARRALDPHLERGHGLHRVLSEERDQRIHVVALERVHVLREQVRVLASTDPAAGARAAPRGWSAPAAARCSPRPRSCRGRRPPRRRAAQHLAQDQRRPLPRPAGAAGRSRTRAGRSRADRRDLRRVAVVGHHPRVGDRRHPRSSAGARRSDSSGGDAGPRSIGSARRFSPRSASRQTLVAIRYSHDRSEDRASNVGRPPGAQHRLLHGVFRLEADPSIR